MIYYFIPSGAPRPAVKSSYQLVQLLHELGVRIAAATENGRAAQDLLATAPVMDRDDVVISKAGSAQVMYADPFDARRVEGAVRIFHDVGLPAQPAMPEPDHLLLSAGAPKHNAVEVGFSVSPYFYYDGTPKFEDVVACACGEDAELCRSIERLSPPVECVTIDHGHEVDSAARMKQSVLFVHGTVSAANQRRLVEAMAAGCVVVAVKPDPVPPFLRHEENCWLTDMTTLADCVQWLLEDRQRGLRSRLRESAVATAAGFNGASHKARLAAFLEGPLAFMKS